MSAPRILYVCARCWDSYPEGCGRTDPNDLRCMPDGSQICDECFDEIRQPSKFDDDGNEIEEERVRWRDLPRIPVVPITEGVA
jgi:hypothetical protein